MSGSGLEPVTSAITAALYQTELSTCTLSIAPDLWTRPETSRAQPELGQQPRHPFLPPHLPLHLPAFEPFIAFFAIVASIEIEMHSQQSHREL